MTSIQENLATTPLKIKKNAKIVIVQSEYNSAITNALAESCIEELIKAGVQAENLLHYKVPGAWELAIAAQKLASSEKPDAIITLGLILKGDTPHFDFIASACATGIMDVSLKANLPITFGVLTTNTLEQAEARIHGGSHGDKGVETAQAAIKMINLF